MELGTPFREFWERRVHQSSLDTAPRRRRGAAGSSTPAAEAPAAPRCWDHPSWTADGEARLAIPGPGACGAVFCRPGDHVWHLGCIFWSFGAVLRAFGSSWEALRGILGDLGRSWMVLGRSWGVLGCSWGRLGRVLRGLGSVLEGLGRSWGDTLSSPISDRFFDGFDRQKGAKREVRQSDLGSQNGSKSDSKRIQNEDDFRNRKKAFQDHLGPVLGRSWVILDAILRSKISLRC